MLSPTTLARNALVQLNVATDRTFTLPLLIFFPTARCNSRCISCDWWKADGAGDLSVREIENLASQLPALGVRVVLFSGGEALLRRDVYEIADIFRAHEIKLHLLTSGLFLERDAEKIAARFENVTISLDGHTRELYQQIRGVDGLALVERGVTKLKRVSPNLPLRARSTLHRHNFRALPDMIDKARAMGLDQISFLSADVTSEAFGRSSRDGNHTLRTEASTRGLLLTAAEVEEFRRIVEDTIQSHATDFDSHFVAESPNKLRRLTQYYAAQLGLGAFPPVACNAPWVSAVIEADGAVRPCYFHHAVGNIREKPLREILNHEMRAFRAALDVSENAICKKCVCTLKVGMRTTLW
jgi:MoaA/NifB/PqqE/SkfB family radical SAM enzyme